MKRSLGTPVLALAVLSLCAGCSVTTTQMTSDRSKLERQRELERRKPVKVVAQSRTVLAHRAQLIRGAHGTALVVELRNRGRNAISDLPIWVGTTDGGTTRALNGRAGRPYWDTHVPLIPAGKTRVWVLPLKGQIHGRPVIKIGAVPAVEMKQIDSIPSILSRFEPAGRGQVVAVENHSDVPQLPIPVYAWAASGGRFVAASRSSSRPIASGDSATVRVQLAGSHAGRLRVSALPTVYR